MNLKYAVKSNENKLTNLILSNLKYYSITNFKKLEKKKYSTTILHGHKRIDKLDIVQNNKLEQSRIIEREKSNYSNWKSLINSTKKEWEVELYNRQVDIKSNENNSYEGEVLGNYIYYNKSHPYKDYEIFYRKRKLSSNFKEQKEEEEIVFDIGSVPFLRNVKRASMKSIKVSNDDEFVAFLIDINNDERTIAGIYNISKKYYYPIILNDVFGLEFGNNSNELFCLKYDTLDLRPNNVTYYKLDYTKIKNNINLDYNIYESNNQCDLIVYKKELFKTENKDELLELSKCKSNEYLIINSMCKNNSEISSICLKSLTVIKLLERKENVLYFVDYSDGYYYILSNIDALKDEDNFCLNSDIKLYSIKAKDTKNKININSLKLILIPDENEYFEDMQVFKHDIVIYSKKNLIPTITVYNIATKKTYKYNINNKLGEITPGINKDYSSNGIKFSFSNPYTMNDNYYLKFYSKNSNLDTSSIKPEKLSTVTFTPKNIQESDYCLEIIDCPSKDGEIIPCTLFYNKKFNNIDKTSSSINFNFFDTYNTNNNNSFFNNSKYLGSTNSINGLKNLKNLKRKNKVLLIGYGAYGLNLELTFDSILLTAVEKGWVIAFAHVRGGFEKGQEWHNKGKLDNKINSIIDYEAVAFELIRQGITHPNYITAYGASAGGTLVAQAVNRNPELYRCAILSYPFLDVISTLLNDKYRLTVTDYKEFGNPITSKNDYLNILSWSPYENISVKEYPAMFITLSVNDSRIQLFSVLKYIEKLRLKALTPSKRLPEFIKGSKNIVVQIEEEGHYGPIDRNEAYDSRLSELAWADKMMIEDVMH